MPYSGVTPGSETEQKIDRCVEEVMGRDSSMDKSGAIAICRSSIENKEMGDVEKFMYGAGGAVSFSELDAVRQAHEQAEELMKLTYDFQSIVDNIMWSPDVSDKGAAIRQLAGEFSDRLDTGNYNKALTLFKEVWTAAYINDLPDSAFLFIESGGTKEGGKTTPRSLRHLHYKDKNGSVDLPHLRNAISRLGQSATGKGWKGFSRESTLKKAQGILSSAEPKKETRLNKFVSAVKGLVKSEQENKDDGNGFLVWKDKGGTYRWIARYSNNLRDDDNPPEIISSKSHQRFEALVDAGVVPPPELWLWHNKDWKIGQSEWVAYDDAGFAMAGGYIFPECEEIAKQLQGVDDAGVSHGMKGDYIRRDVNDPSIIVQHITHEISPLPLWAAANKRTGFVVLDEDKEINMLSKDKRQELIRKWGFSEDYLTALERLNKEDSDNAIGVERKETSEDTVTPEEVVVETQAPAPDTAVAEAEPVEEQPVANATTELPTPAPEQPAAADPELLLAVEETMKAVMTLTKELRELAAEVQEVKKSEEKKIADMVKQSPLASLTHMMVNSVIGSEATRVDGRTTLAKGGPQETVVPDRSVTGIPFVDRMLTNADQKSA